MNSMAAVREAEFDPFAEGTSTASFRPVKPSGRYGWPTA
jgi:hypothetical protein